MASVAEFWHRIERSLFPCVAENLGHALTEELQSLVAILETLRIEEQRVYRPQQRVGRKLSDRAAIARAFVAKASLNLPDTLSLINRLRQDASLRRILGWEQASQVPSEATFSRAFAEFALCSLGETVHQALVSTYVGERIIGHISRDSTAIEARERPAVKPEKPKKPKPKKRGRPRKDEPPREPQPTRLERQMKQTAEEAIAELPTLCDVGAKKNAKGYISWWTGWKAHIDVADGGLPITVLTTSASLHDSQAAIPMMKRTAGRVISLYDLMDSAYDAEPIHTVSRALNHRPIIAANKRRGEATPFDPATALRYNERTTAERVNARLKDEFGGRNLRVRGHAKAHLHIMFGILALFADQLLLLARS